MELEEWSCQFCHWCLRHWQEAAWAEQTSRSDTEDCNTVPIPNSPSSCECDADKVRSFGTTTSIVPTRVSAHKSDARGSNTLPIANFSSSRACHTGKSALIQHDHVNCAHSCFSSQLWRLNKDLGGFSDKPQESCADKICRWPPQRVDDIQFVSGYNITLCIRPDEKQLMTRGQKTYPLTHLFQVSRTIQEVSFEDLAALPRTLWKRVKYPEVYRTYPQDVSMNQIVKAVKAGLAVTDVRLHFYLKNRICHIMRKMISFQANDKINLLWIYLVIFIHLPDATVQFPHPHSANQHDSLFA
ncbi:unnamed protein product [Mesocestoides corti]|uniref:Uncharacterized protein n=1 Tax=Mesocestoides corti TaxID=53468 RepID=A0A0R3UQ67_MESCO|nr:unnamed protein product [Mesocestoides corti]